MRITPDHNEYGEIIRTDDGAPSAPISIHHPPDHNEYGEIIRTHHDSSSGGDKGAFMATTLIVSPIIYSVVGIWLNEALEIYMDPGAALVLGGLFGLIVSAIYNSSFAEEYDAKDYIYSIGLPGAILAVIGIGIVILIVIVILVAIGIALGGG